MLGSDAEEEFLNDIAAGDANAAGKVRLPLTVLLVAAIGLFFLWASFSRIEQYTSGQGRVIPSSQIQIVQSLDGGVIREIMVGEGDQVTSGQVLLRIDDTTAASSLAEFQKQKAAIQAEQGRLLAEATLLENLAFDPVFAAQNAAAVEAEQEVFASRQAQLSNELSVLENRLSQKQFELLELEATNEKLSGVVTPLRKEAELTRKMVEQGVLPEVEFLRLESRLAELDGDLKVVNATRPKLEAAIQEAENMKATTTNNFVLSARERLAKLEGELAIVDEKIKVAVQRMTRTQLRAPVNGIVNKINVTTVGGVIQPGREILEIVPVDESLLIEARVRPQDVAFLKPNEPASVKLTAYDYLIYGDLEAKVVRIGADTIQDANGEDFYQVIVRTNKDHIAKGDEKLPVIPGMVATVDIKTGENTVLSYLLKPILRARHEAIRER